MRKNDTLLGNSYSKIQKKIEISAKKQSEISLKDLCFTGSVSSVKKNDDILYMSSLECDFISIIEFDKAILRYFVKPFKISYYKANALKCFIPSFYIEYCNGIKDVIEIKYSDDLEHNQLLFKKKFEIVEKFCQDNSFNFKVLTEKEIQTDRLFNATFLLSYRYPKFGFNINDTQFVICILEQYGKLTVQQLLDFALEDEAGKYSLLYTVWYMVANYMVNFNDDARLSMQTVLWI